MGRFETSDSNSARWHRPVKVPQAKGGVFSAARELVDDLDGWNVERVDEDALSIHCTKANGFLGGTSKITITVTGPDGIPSSETSVVSESDGILSRDKKNVASFCQKFWMRVT